MFIKTIKCKPFIGLNETERSMQLTIHQESSHNPQVQGHGFRKQEEGQKERKKSSQKRWKRKSMNKESTERWISKKLRK